MFKHTVNGKVKLELGVIEGEILIRTIPIGNTCEPLGPAEIRLELETAKWLSDKLIKNIQLLEYERKGT